MATKRIYNVAAKDSFVDVLAQHFLAEYRQHSISNLANVLFLLPNRRACRDLADAFVRANGLMPTILPQMLPIADTSEDEVLISGQADLATAIQPAVGSTERLFYLTGQIMQHAQILGLNHITPAQAYDLAQNLTRFLDSMYQHDLGWNKLDELTNKIDKYAAHWQHTLDLLTTLKDIWPQYLQSQNKIDDTKRRQMLLEAELTYWQQTKTTTRIVVAGTTAAFPILKKLVKTVADLPNGEIWLYGLDSYLSEDDWQEIEVHHPQYELKELLDCLKIKRSQIQNIGQSTPHEILISETMRPATTTHKWNKLHYNTQLAKAFDNMHIVNCDDVRQEAAAIALIIRDTLEIPEKTAAFVTADRNLARRVVAELKRWNITADDSAGQPLGLTPIGIYLRLIADVASGNFMQTDCAALLKHPFTALGMNKAKCRSLARELELYWRGSHKIKDDLSEDAKLLLSELYQRLQPLVDIYKKQKTDLKEMITAHISVAESLADTDQKSGDKIIWRQDSGQIAADFVNDLLHNSNNLEKFSPYEYANLLAKMLSAQNVRIRYGMHPRVKILGPIEARLTQYDVTIIGEANEGFWPALPPTDMLMSRQMRSDFGLPDTERNIGVAAADFAHLLNAPEVYITRALRLDGTPTTKSRWLLRLETVLTALLGEKEKIYTLYDRKFAAWAKFAERAETLQSIKAPEPQPAVDKRPLKISASNINALFRDPYTIFAKYILQLYPLENLDRPFDRRDYGNIVHKTIEIFNLQYNTSYPLDAKAELMRIGEEQFAKAKVPTEVRVFWWPKFEQTVDWLTSLEQEYRKNVIKVYSEIEGRIEYNLSEGRIFTLTAKADRIDITADGSLNLIDYKTGSSGYPQSLKDFKCAYAPQLPSEALIALGGGYADLGAATKINSLSYWLLGKNKMTLNNEDTKQLIELTDANIKHRLHEFYEQTPPAAYIYKPSQTNPLKHSDYEHLARYREWGTKESSEE